MNGQIEETQGPPALTVVTPSPWQGGWLFKAVKLIIFSVVVFFTARELIRRLMLVTWPEIDFRPSFLILAAVCQALAMFLVSWAYDLLLKASTHSPGWGTVWAIMSVVRLGKYLPGKFASTVGAMWLFSRRGVPVSVAAGVTVMIQGLIIVLSLLASVPLTLWRPVYNHLPLAWLWCGLLVVTGLVCLHPRIFHRIVNFVLVKLRLPRLADVGRIRDYGWPVTLMVAGQIITGMGLWLTIRSVSDLSGVWFPLCISAVALAGALGLLALFAPGGLGVREGILLIILGPIIGPGRSAIVVIAARVLLILVELAAAGGGLTVLYVLGKRRPRLE